MMNTLFSFDTSEKSSAISTIIVSLEESIVKIVYNSNIEKSYEFFTDSAEYVVEEIRKTLQKNESIGKLIHQFKKDQIIEPFPVVN